MRPLNKVELNLFVDALTKDLFDNLISEYIPYSLESKAEREIKKSLKDSINFEGVVVCDPTED